MASNDFASDSVRLTGFNPIIDSDSRILILGTFPSEISLKSDIKEEYYANSANQFWKIMQKNIGILVSLPYNERKDLLKKHHIGLWDIISSCERTGSSDKTIKNPEYNDIYFRINKYPNVQMIILNGKSKTRKEMKKYCKKLKQDGYSFPDSLKIKCAPSTSPQNRTPFDDKCELWKKLMDFSKGI